MRDFLLNFVYFLSYRLLMRTVFKCVGVPFSVCASMRCLDSVNSSVIEGTTTPPLHKDFDICQQHCAFFAYMQQQQQQQQQQ